jgi:hypothetical protein
VTHGLPADQVKMPMEDGLPAARSRIRDDAIPRFGKPLLDCQLPRHPKKAPREGLILRRQSAHGFDVTIQHDQDMRRRNRTNIAER